MHVPIALGGRLFGVLSAMHQVPGRFGEADLRRLVSLGVGAAGAISHALEFEHERRVARALTARLRPGPARPADRPGARARRTSRSRTRSAAATSSASGRSRAARWRCSIGDVSGKGLEVAAASSMVRFFVEARAWDTEHPAQVLAQANRILRARLQRGGFATAFLAMVSDGRLRYCNAGHPPPLLLRADGSAEPLRGSGLPLGIEEDGRHEEREVAMELGDVLFAATDGLLETRRERAFFSDARLPGLLAEHGRTLPPQAARRARLRGGAGVGARAPRRRRRARAAARAGARAARRARERPGRAGAVGRVPGARARAARPGLRARGGDLRHRARVRGAGRGVRRALRPRPAGRAAAACARWGRSWPRSSACSSPPTRAGRATAAACWPSSSGARPRPARSACGCSPRRR